MGHNGSQREAGIGEQIGHPQPSKPWKGSVLLPLPAFPILARLPRAARGQTYFDMRVLRAGGAPDTGASLLLPVLEVLGALQDRHPPSRVAECQCLAALQLLLVLRGDRQHNGDAQVDNTIWQERDDFNVLQPWALVLGTE